jgi:inhibitor of cysteine peptidase
MAEEGGMIRIGIFVSAGFLLCSPMLITQPPQSAGAGQKSVASVVIVTDRDNGTEVDLPAADTLVVRLKSNPSTGYIWAVKSDASPLRLMKSSTKKTGESGHNVGATVVQEFRLTAATAGIATLTLEYRRPWEYTSGPAKTFTIKVNAR